MSRIHMAAVRNRQAVSLTDYGVSHYDDDAPPTNEYRSNPMT